MRTKYFAVSFNPSYYDADEIMEMSLDEVKEFVKNEIETEDYCLSTFEGDVDKCDKLVPEGNSCDLDALCVWFY